jgi:hypothetical protein
MKAILTRKGARRHGLRGMGNKVVSVTDLRTMPFGSRNATVLVDGKAVARSVHVYTPEHGKNCGLILLAS